VAAFLVILERSKTIMNYYVDITLRSDPEFSTQDLMDALFNKLHRALVAVGSKEIGLSFPKVHAAQVGFGTVLRLHGTQDKLKALMATPWLTGMRDHVTLSVIQEVPVSCSTYCTVSRVQVKSSPERERRRLIRRKGLSEKQAIEKIPDESAKTVDWPYLHLRSQSTGQRFNLFIRHSDIVAAPVSGDFGMYGLSAKATVPWF
jgi:CRISPR-associated endonuclease Csy4